MTPTLEFTRAWQTFLNLQGKKGKDGQPLLVDGDFGGNTRTATIGFQSYFNIPQTGEADDATIAVAVANGFKPPASEGKYKFVQAKWFTAAARTAIDLIVIHTMEAPEKGTTAEAVANYFANPLTKTGDPVKASAHFCIDNDSVVACVREQDVAWHAGGANRNGIGLEHAGTARQTPAEWADEYSTAMLKRSAQVCAELCLKYGLPVVWLTPDQIKAKERGICGHVDVNVAAGQKVGDKGVHWDPGPSFPKDQYIQWVEEALENMTNSTFPST